MHTKATSHHIQTPLRLLPVLPPPLTAAFSRPNSDSSTDLHEFSRRLPTRVRAAPASLQSKAYEAVVTQKLGKAPSPPKDQPALYPCLDWSAMQVAYYPPGFLPPTYFSPGLAPGHAPHPYMWGPQPLLPSASGKPYTAIYPNGGGFSHPFMPLMVNPLSVEPAISVNSKENGLNMKLKKINETAVSTCSGNSDKTSGDSVEGSSDGNNQKESGTPKKRRFYDRSMSDDKNALDYSPAAETGGTSAANDRTQEPGTRAIVPNLGITAIRMDASSDLNIIGTAISAEFPYKDDRESKRERRKQSNRESARRSRLRKQAETEELAKKVEQLTANNTSLRREISRLTESSRKLRLQNSALMEKLSDSAPDQAQEGSADQTTEHSAAAGAVKIFMPLIDSTSAPRSIGHLGHGAPKLRQLLGSGLAADAVAAR